MATTAWSLALLLGAAEVVFCGLDLGYPRGGSHVQGSQFEERKHRLARRLQPAETWSLGWLGEAGLTPRPAVNGGTIVSDPRMDLYRAWLALEVARHPEVRAWSLSSQGSRIPGLATPPAGFAEAWPLQQVPAWPLGPRIAGLGADQPLGDQVPGLAGFPETVSTTWVDRWDAEGQQRWGEGWEMLAGPALRSWRQFPSNRTKQSLSESWRLVESLESQIFRSSLPGEVRS